MEPSMGDRFLHNLDLLPKECRVWTAGRPGRNRRFARTLEVLRPDVTVTHTLEADENGCMPGAEAALAGASTAAPAEAPDRILVTGAKYRRMLPFIRKLQPDVPWQVVNPTFCHPFLHEELETDYRESMERAAKLFENPRDRAAYDLYLWAVRPTPDLSDACFKLLELHASMTCQYLDFVNPAGVRTVLEGGVGDGTTTVRFHGYFGLPEIHGFEPDPAVLEISHLKRFVDAAPNIHIHPEGLWNRSGRLSFHSQTKGRSHLASAAGGASEEAVDLVTVDEFVKQREMRKVDFIKLDVEGAEPEALEGARETLFEHRPQLAVCIYHRFDHYYRIPLWLAEHVENYVFRIGHYSDVHIYSETVLYAIPSELYRDSEKPFSL
jgi:FkbM family methyltransferase